MKNPNPLEKDIEKKVCDYARKLGCLIYKFTSPARRSVPDRIFLHERVETFWIEFKRKEQKPTAAQAVEIEKIRTKGKTVFVIDNIEDGKLQIDMMLL